MCPVGKSECQPNNHLQTIVPVDVTDVSMFCSLNITTNHTHYKPENLTAKTLRSAILTRTQGI